MIPSIGNKVAVEQHGSIYCFYVLRKTTFFVLVCPHAKDVVWCVPMYASKRETVNEAGSPPDRSNTKKRMLRGDAA